MGSLQRRGRPSAAPTNSLILLLPMLLFSKELLPLFRAHFADYGTMVSWTPLEKLGRVFVIYVQVEDAVTARREMDGFIWEDEADADDQLSLNPIPFTPPTSVEVDIGAATTPLLSRIKDAREPLRAFFGPQISLPLPSLHSTLLAVPALSKNFLISPPGSPPVGWEQTLEEAPNRKALPEHPVTGSLGWEDELARALRFLSVSAGDEEDGPSSDAIGLEVKILDGAATLNTEGISDVPATQLVVPPALDGGSRPAVTVSAPLCGHVLINEGSPPHGATRITSVKATIESMLVRKKSFGDIKTAASSTLKLGDVHAGSKITPTARPPVNGDRPYED